MHTAKQSWRFGLLMTPSGVKGLMAWFTVMSCNEPVMGSNTGGLFSSDPFNPAGNPLPSPHDPHTGVYIVYIYSDLHLNCNDTSGSLQIIFLILQLCGMTNYEWMLWGRTQSFQPFHCVTVCMRILSVFVGNVYSVRNSRGSAFNKKNVAR